MRRRSRTPIDTKSGVCYVRRAGIEMSGIAGIIGRIDDRSAQAVARMRDALAHRGPDAHGRWTSAADEDGWGAILAHCRVDGPSRTAQPLSDATTGHVLVFSGALHDTRELRERTTDPDARTLDDTALMLRALARHGLGATPWIQGSYACATWDPEARRLCLARDALGVQPLYVLRSDDPAASWALAFASELRALLASGLIAQPRLDPRAAASLVWNGFVVGPETAVEGVRLLAAGRGLLLDARGKLLEAREAWTLPAGPRAPHGDATRFAVDLTRSVAQRLGGERPPVVLLSGGVASAAVADLARRARGAPLPSLTLGFEGRPRGAADRARRFASAMETEHTEATLTEHDFLAALDPALDALDQPSISGLHAYYLGRAARDAGFAAALSGSGARAILGASPVFHALPRLHRWRDRVRWLPADVLALGAHALGRARGTHDALDDRWSRWAALIAKSDDLTAVYQRARAVLPPPAQRAILAPGLAATLLDGLTPDIRVRLDGELAGRSARSTLAVLEQRLSVGEQLLRDGDAASMVSLRRPFVDPALWDAVDRLPEALRFGEGARMPLLEDLVPALGPDEDHTLPYGVWIRRGWRAEMAATLGDPGAVAAAGLEPPAVERVWRVFEAGGPLRAVWAFYVLVRWCQRHGVRR